MCWNLRKEGGLLFSVFRRGNFWIMIRFRIRIKFKNLASFAIPFDAKQDLILCISTFPAGALRMKVGWATRINIFWTIKKSPAGCLPVPEIRHSIPPDTGWPHSKAISKKSNKKIKPWSFRTSSKSKEGLRGVGNEFLEPTTDFSWRYRLRSGLGSQSGTSVGVRESFSKSISLPPDQTGIFTLPLGPKTFI